MILNHIQTGASPNPSCEQEVQVVKGDVEVKVQNKNLLDVSNLITQNINGVAITKNEDLSITLNGTSTSPITIDVPIEIILKENITYTFSKNTITGAASFALSLRDIDKNYVGSASLDSGNKYINITLNTEQTAKYFRLYIANGKTFANYTFYPMLEINSTATSYTPHQEQTLPLTLGDIELCKIGDYKDYPWKDLTNGKWYWHKETGKMVLDGSENEWAKSSNTTEVDRFTYNTDLYVNNANSKCNYFIKSEITTTIGRWYNNANVQVEFSFTEYGTTTLEEWKEWLSTHNLILVQPLVTPTDIEITDTTLINQLEAINNAISYYEQTNISGTSSGINPLFDVEAYQSTKLLLEDIINSN